MLRYALCGCSSPARAGMLGHDVVAAAARPATTSSRSSRADLDLTDAATCAASIAAARPDAVINCAAWTDVDGAEADEAAATARQRRRARATSPPPRRRPARSSSTSRPTTSSTARERAVRSSPTRRARSAPTGARSSPARSASPPRPTRTRSSAPPGCSAPAASNFVATMLRARRGARRGQRRRRPGRLPDVHRAPRPRAGRDRRAARRRRHPPRRRRRRVLVVRARGRDLRGAGVRCRVLPTTADRFRPARAAPRLLRAALRARRRARPAAVAGRACAAYLERAVVAP